MTCLSTIRDVVVFFLLTTLFAAAIENPPPDYDATIVEVIATTQEYDVRIPWRKKPPQIRRGLGVVVAGNQVLTAEGIIRNNTLVEIRRAKSGTKIESKTLEADEQINAALLQINNQAAAEKFKSVAITEKIKRNDVVTIVKMDASGQFQSNEGQVIEIVSSPHGLLLKVLTDMSIDSNGTPVFLGDTRHGDSPRQSAMAGPGAPELAGIVINYDKNTQTCTVLSGITLKKFLSDAAKPPYQGVAWAGLAWEPVLDPAKRKFMGVGENDGGILVANTVPGSGAAEVLQAEDVILEVDGYKLDELGYYHDPDFGRLMFTYLVNGRHAPGEQAELSIVRNRQKIAVKLPLKRQVDCSQIIPENTAGGQAEYLAEGGLILRELTGDYLRANGHEWLVQTNPRLVYYYFNPWRFSRKEGEHIVILSGVLPDEINIGYHEYHDEVVTAVNGKTVRCLADVFATVAKDGGLKRVSLMGCAIDLVIDEKGMPEANRRIAAGYRIPSLRYQRITAKEKRL